MAKFVMECPRCGKYAEARTGVFARKKIDCTCGYVIDVRTDKLAGRTCPHCGNEVVFDQSKGAAAKCPVCGSPINTMAEQNKVREFSCVQCGIRLQTAESAETCTCPVCDCVNDVQERLMAEKIKNEGLASVIKYEGDADTLAWKHPVEDFNWGSQLIVHESQEAIFFRNGQALDTFGPGRYTLETQQLPVLERLYGTLADPNQAFHSEVYFFNCTTQMALKWGTPDKVRFIDPLTDAPISVGARGQLNFRIGNSRKLLMKLVGTTGTVRRQDILGEGNSEVRNYFRSVVQTTVSTCLADAIVSNNVDLLQVDRQRLVLSDSLREKVAPAFADYGLEVTEFLVEGILLPQPGDLGYDAMQTVIKLRQRKLTEAAIENERAIRFAEMEAKKQVDIRQQENLAQVELAHREAVTAKGQTTILEAQLESQRKYAATSAEVEAERLRLQLEMERKAQTARIEAEEMRLKGYSQKDVLQADVMRAFAEHPSETGTGMVSGVAGDAMRMGLGFAAMGATVGMAKDVIGTGLTGAQGLGSAFAQGFAAAPAASAASSAAAPAAPDTWDCPACGQRGITSRFCPNCGGKRPEPALPSVWTCTVCGTADITSKFCPNCGAKRPEVPAVWNCPDCGTANISTNFCPNCGRRKGV